MCPHRAIVVSLFVLLATPACDPIVRLGGVLGGASGSGTAGGAGGLTGGGGRGGSGAGGPGGAGATGPLLWTATFEPGDLSEWLTGGDGGYAAVNVTPDPSTTTEFAHTGRYSGKAVLMPSSQMQISFEWFYRDTPSPPEAYYSAWFYIPVPYAVKTWLSIMHFQGSKTNDGRNTFPTWDINLNPQSDGSLTAQLYNFVTMKSLLQAQPVAVPIAKWFHLEVLLKKAINATGGVAVWQDGTAILKVEDVATVYQSDWTEFMVGSSADAITPAVGAIYVDDAAISLTRVGPGG